MVKTPDKFLDARGLLCPLPVLKAQKQLKAMKTGSVLRIEATDPMSVIDFPHFCEESGHELVNRSQEGDLYIFELQKA